MRLSDDVLIMGNRALCRSNAKINLTLDVVGKRDDGYHNVQMIMQTINLYDVVTVDRSNYGIKITSNRDYLPTDEKNIAYKAALMFFKETGISGGAKIQLYKNIPVVAGLAGGSGNAGAVLCALNKLYGNPVSEKKLLNMGTELGADVPFCMTGGTCLCEGIGEILTPIDSAASFCVLLVKPPVSVSTAAIYEKMEEGHIQKRPDNNKMTAALKSGDVKAAAHELCNVMEPVTGEMHPVIGGIKQKMLMHGALGAVMSGSGPTVFGIFDDEARAKQLADDFYMQFKDVFLCRTV